MKSKIGKITIVTIILLLATVAGLVAMLYTPVQAAGNGKYEFAVYNSYTAFSYRLIRFEDKQIWNASTLTLSTTTPYANSYTVVAADVLVGGYPIDLDAALPNGEYDFLWYSTATPIYTDVPEGGFRIVVANGRLASTPIMFQ